MVDYYKSNAIYDNLRENKSFQFVSGNSWILVYGNKKDEGAKIIVLVHGISWKEDYEIIETLKKINKLANIPVCRISFDDSEYSKVNTINYYELIDGNNTKKYSLNSFKNYLKKVGLDIEDGECDKYLNDKTSSAYHKWQRETLGNKIIVSDLDLIRIDLKTKNPIEIIELKRSSAALDKWTPYSDDYINFNLVDSIAKKINAPLNIIYNRMIKNMETKVISADIVDKVSIFSYSKNNYKKIKTNYEFSYFSSGKYINNNIGMKMKFWTGNEIIDLKDGQIFVFGSNPVL